MHTYTLLMQTTTGGVPWRHEFTIANDEMARRIAKRWCEARNLPQSCMCVVLFSEEGEIAEYTIETQITERRP